MNLYMLEPEVAGEIGENTVYDNYDEIVNDGAKPKISHLHFIFSGWLGDDIIESTPCFIITEQLKERIEASGLTGYDFQDVEISLSEEFVDLYPDRKLPNFIRLNPKGTVNLIDYETYENWSGDDFNLSDKSYLVVSQQALDILKEGNIDNADIYKLNVKIN